ncbi:MAG: ABC-F type ribosomal protection protein [Eubacterium sp.]|nr:ABC-F type ribosomal protection protein [Eubacterium sp.]
MSMIKVENLTFSYPSSMDTVFENVCFQIDTSWKLGFVGRNGRGKTTFLNLLLGKYEYSGKIISSVQFDYFPYPVEDKTMLTMDILQKICPLAEEWEIMRELSLLQVDAEVLYRAFETLSNGEQTKTLLAALFLNEGHFLLIDEPTNHLDTRARTHVADYLKKKKGFILVSHDRRFLDECVDHVLSLNRANIEVQSGNFSSWMMNFERQNAFEKAQNEKLQKSIKQLQQSARHSAVWSDRVEASKTGAYDKGFVGHKAAKMMKRSKAIEARKEQAVEQKSRLLKNTETAEDLKIFPLVYHSNQFASFSEVSAVYNGKQVCKPVSFTINQGDRIVLDGKNGSGKSSLLKLLVGENIEHTGSAQISSGLIISYVPQDMSGLKGKVSDFAYENNIEESLFKTVLSKLDFDESQFLKDMQNFSEGQKKKVLIAKSLCEQAHLYVWDEPLNFMDIYSRMQIEQLINAFSLTMIFVEHDCAFREAIATKTIEL